MIGLTKSLTDKIREWLATFVILMCAKCKLIRVFNAKNAKKFMDIAYQVGILFMRTLPGDKFANSLFISWHFNRTLALTAY